MDGSIRLANEAFSEVVRWVEQKKTKNRYFVGKETRMNVAELQLQLHQAIDRISDSEKLEAIYTLLKGSKGPFEPMSMEEYVVAIDESRQ